MADSTSTNDLTYTPTTWADGADGGTAITAARLNNIEQGINSASKQVNANTKSIKTLGDSVSQLKKVHAINGDQYVSFDWASISGVWYFRVYVNGACVWQVKATFPSV